MWWDKTSFAYLQMENPISVNINVLHSIQPKQYKQGVKGLHFGILLNQLNNNKLVVCHCLSVLHFWWLLAIYWMKQLVDERQQTGNHLWEKAGYFLGGNYKKN